MEIVYVLLGVIFALFIVLFFVVLIRVNNKKIEGELEYLAENYEVESLKNTELVGQGPTIVHPQSNTQYYIPPMYQNVQGGQVVQGYVMTRNGQVMQPVQVITQPVQSFQQVHVAEAPAPTPVKQPTEEDLKASAAIAQSIADSLKQPYYKAEEPKKEVASEAPQVQTQTQSEPVQNPNVSPFAEHNNQAQTSAPNILDMPTLHTTDLIDQSVEIPGLTTAPEAIPQDSPNEESIEVKGSAQLEETGEEFEVVDPAEGVAPQSGEAVISETKPTYPPVQPKPTNTTPIGYENANQTAFHTEHDGNTAINQNINYVEPKKEFTGYKTEIWDMTEVIKELNKDEEN